MQKYDSKPKKRKPTSQRNQQLHPTVSERRTIKNHEVILVCIIIVAILGAGIAFFAAGSGIVSILAGVVIGGLIGYFFGVQIVKGLSKN